MSIDSLRSRQWLWLAVLIYSFALAMNWTHPVARYLVPITPLILVGIFTAVPRLLARHSVEWIFAIYAGAMILGWNDSTPNKFLLVARPLIVIAVFAAGYFAIRGWFMRATLAARQTGAQWLVGFFVTMVVLCNGALWGCDVYVARSSSFYEKYEAGLNRDLIAAMRWLNQQKLGDHEIAVSKRYENMGRKKRDSQLGIRVAAMLADKAVAAVPDKYVGGGDPRKNPNFLAWARSIDVKYVLYQPPVSPWRVFHFRLGWLQKLQTGQPVEDSGAGWRLYFIPPSGDEARRISLTPAGNWPTRVPGLE
jgi:hypothetical protein